MTRAVFLRLVDQEDKAAALADAVVSLRADDGHPRSYVVDVDSFRRIPRAPFAYWAPAQAFQAFDHLPSLESHSRFVRCGMGTLDNFRFLRIWWEVSAASTLTGTSNTAPSEFREMTANGKAWVNLAKGGAFSPYYGDLYLVVNFANSGLELKTYVAAKVGSASRKIQAESFYFRSGLTWTQRTQSGLSVRVLPKGCIFGDKGPAVLVAFDDQEELSSLLGLMNSQAFAYLVSLQMAF